VPTYLIRNRETERAVGIFAVTTFDELIELVKRADDPERCDYASVGDRGSCTGMVFTPVLRHGEVQPEER
jgi:hypothetical protein